MEPNVASTDPERGLRVGLMLDDLEVEEWKARAIAGLQRVDGVSICVVLRRRSGRRPQLSPPVWRLVEHVRARRSPADQPADMTVPLADVPVLDLSPVEIGRWDLLSTNDLERVRAYAPDALLRLGWGLLGGSVLSACPLGVWSFHHGDERKYRGGPPAFWEVADGATTTGVVLQRLTERLEGGVPLARARFATVPHSYRRNREQALFGAAELPAQVCQRVLGGDRGLCDRPQTLSVAPFRPTPGAPTLARLAPTFARRWARRQFDGLTKADRWHVGLLPRPIETILDDPELRDVRWLPRPTGTDRYVADPFGCPTSDGGHAVLVEDFDYRDRHGRIAAYRLDPDGSIGQPVPVATFPGHASYPMLARVADEWWCVPETSQDRSVQAFAFDPQSLRWELICTLLDDVALADPTLFEWNGRWWLFGTDRDRGANTHLRAWWSEHPRGPWHQHAVDPLLIDVRSARGAGTPFVHHGALYRPAQDCSGSYGGAVELRRITLLDPTSFSEELATRVEPERGPYPDGVHTLSALGELTLVDGTVHRFSARAFTHELRARLVRGRVGAAPDSLAPDHGSPVDGPTGAAG